jgi:UDP-N-acetylmuramoylalanine--D-glutamate ligase
MTLSPHQHLLILGLARQGKALARFAAGLGMRVTISDLRPAAVLQAELAELEDLPLTYVLGEHPLSLLDEVDLIALSGSVPVDAPFVQAGRNRGIALTNDSLEFTKLCPAEMIGITGSAGKSTTTTLTGLMGQLSGRTTWVGGNLGNPLITDLAQIKAADLVVQELSSFQLELWDTSPHIAGLLNITPNHLDRHKTMTAYAEAKTNILRYQTSQDIAVLCAEDEWTMKQAPLVNGRLRTFQRTGAVNDGAFIRQGAFWLRDGAAEKWVCAVSNSQLRGEHNQLNILAACTLADSAGIPLEAMQEAIRTFKGVAHRLEVVRNYKGVLYINDSIATAPERALAAVASFTESLVLLAGGRDKDMVWETWAKTVAERVKKIILFGDLAPTLAQKLQQTGRTENIFIVQTLAEAVQCATAQAQAGDVVLLSPGGTSYDAFRDFVERGELFRQLVFQIGTL